MTRFEARGRGVYHGADLIGMMADPADAALVAEALAARERVALTGPPLDRDPTVPQTCLDGMNRPVEPGDCELTGPHYVTTLGVPHGRPAGRAAVPLSATATVTCGRVGMHNCGVTGRWQSHDPSEPLPEPATGSYP